MLLRLIHGIWFWQSFLGRSHSSGKKPNTEASTRSHSSDPLFLSLIPSKDGNFRNTPSFHETHLYQFLSRSSFQTTRQLKMMLYPQKTQYIVFLCLYEETNAYAFLRMRIYIQHYPPTYQVYFDEKDKHNIFWSGQVVSFIVKPWGKWCYFCALPPTASPDKVLFCLGCLTLLAGVTWKVFDSFRI